MSKNTQIRVRHSLTTYVDKVDRGTENINNTQIFPYNSKIIPTSTRGR